MFYKLNLATLLNRSSDFAQRRIVEASLMNAFQNMNKSDELLRLMGKVVVNFTSKRHFCRIFNNLLYIQPFLYNFSVAHTNVI